jgi:hypothetical protein
LRISAAAYYNEAVLGAFVAAIYPRPSNKDGAVSFFSTVIDNRQSIPEQYREFEDVFDEEEAGKLA